MHVAKFLVRVTAVTVDLPDPNALQISFSDSVAGPQGMRHLLRTEGPTHSPATRSRGRLCAAGRVCLGSAPVLEAPYLTSPSSALHLLPAAQGHALQESCAGTPTTGTPTPR